MRQPCVAVIDVGKTHAKLTLWNTAGELVARHERANQLVQGPEYRALDVTGIENWLADTLSAVGAMSDIRTIVPVGHGAAAAIISDGQLACLPVDYEQSIPESTQIRYRGLRDEFEVTGSPPLPGGLNLGAQLYWLQELYADRFRHDAYILTWAQYWAWTLCGEMATEVTSLGCHTDLWLPATNQPSALALGQHWAARLAPVRRADEVLGRLSKAWVAKTGLSSETTVLCGIHDSNAALLAARGFDEIAGRDATVMSTGTWFLAMRTRAPADARPVRLAQGRDCLLNVDISGNPVPTTRFMGGREMERLSIGNTPGLEDAGQPTELTAAVQEVIRSDCRVLPTLASGVGPYPHARFRWDHEPGNAAQRQAAIGLYLALVADTSLDLIGARSQILIEGRFAQYETFVRALASLREDCEIYVSSAQNGVAFGALRLVNPDLKPSTTLRRVEPFPIALHAYQSAWRIEAERLECFQ